MPKMLALPLIFLLFFAVSCDKKKDRLSSDTLTITIDPPASQSQTVTAGESLQMKAICSSAQGAVNISPTWSAENHMGTFSPCQGKETVFSAGTTSGTVKIFAAYGSIRGETTVTIAEKCATNNGGTGGGTGGSSGGSGGSGDCGGSGGSSGGGSGGTGGTGGSGGSGGSGGCGGSGGSGGGLNESTNANYYGLLSETFVIPGILLDTKSSRFPDGGCMGVWPDADHTVLSDDTGEKTEGMKSLKCDIGITGGGWWLQFGSDGLPGLSEQDSMNCRDMTRFQGGALKFDIKTTQDILIGVQWGDTPRNVKSPSADVTLRELGVPIDGQWHSVSIPLSRFCGMDMRAVKVPCSFSAAPGAIFFPFWVDNVRWEKCP